MNERPTNPLKRLAWFLGWDSTPDEEVPTPEARRNRALSDASPLWNTGPEVGEQLPSNFHPWERAGYSLLLVMPLQDKSDLTEPLETWEHDGFSSQSQTLRCKRHDALLILELPDSIGMKQTLDLMGWLAFHPSNNLGERDIRLFGIHRESDQSFVAVLEPKSDFVIGRFKNYQAFCAHVPGIWKFPEAVVEYQDAPQRLSYNEALEQWGIHEFILLDGFREELQVELALADRQMQLPA